MKTLIIYDEVGNIFSSPIAGSYNIPHGKLQYLEIEVPAGKLIKCVNVSVTPNVPIYEDIPLSETELLKKRVEEQESALIELAGLLGGNV